MTPSATQPAAEVSEKLGAEKPRLLVVGPLPPPPGGGETVTQVLINSNLNEGYNLRHFDTSRRVSKETMGRWTGANALWATRYLFEFKRVLRTFQPHIVHLPIASNRPATVRDALFSKAAAVSGARIVMHNHSGLFDQRYNGAGPLWKRYVRTHLGRASAMICLTPYWKEFFDSLELPIRTEVIYNPVSPDFIHALDQVRAAGARNERQEAKQVHILYVGAICEPKGVPELLLACEELMERVPGAILTLVGGPQYPGHYERIQALYQTLKHADRMRFVGPLFGEDLARAYADADVFVLPSHSEGLPMVLLEAMAAGLPIVSTAVGGIPDVIAEGRNGLLVPPRDGKALLGALERIVESGDLRARMGEVNECDAREKYSAEAFAAACDELYQTVLLERPW